ncbi:MAG: hypothetical protein NMNS01_24370 [Nitrosomonas sp.]|nr:MAG: hypothetical protein NMNS01_24370 [Nitrosomonas sp.]
MGIQVRFGRMSGVNTELYYQELTCVAGCVNDYFQMSVRSHIYYADTAASDNNLASDTFRYPHYMIVTIPRRMT